jgi:hypothetical protein
MASMRHALETAAQSQTLSKSASSSALVRSADSEFGEGGSGSSRKRVKSDHPQFPSRSQSQRTMDTSDLGSGSPIVSHATESTTSAALVLENGRMKAALSADEEETMKRVREVLAARRKRNVLLGAGWRATPTPSNLMEVDERHDSESDAAAAASSSSVSVARQASEASANGLSSGSGSQGPSSLDKDKDNEMMVVLDLLEKQESIIDVLRGRLVDPLGSDETDQWREWKNGLIAFLNKMPSSK